MNNNSCFFLISYLYLKADTIGGQERIRRLWRHYFDDTDGLIFVVDSGGISENFFQLAIFFC